ncbi:MAG TPA: F0F1 ATP synthase subunit A [Pirellulales bacterium]|nr:F0F1 ATP synthase subunit A [Pirellulales bacterium]
MADPVLHIKDGYFFEIPKFLRPHPYGSLDDVPQFLLDAHPHEPLAAFNRDMAGKILIPQPFATLKNLYDKESGFAISKYMVLELFAATIVAFIFIRVAKRISSGAAPRGKSWNFFEAMLLFVRDEVAVPAMGKHEAERFTPLLWTMFFFILTCNLLGLVPWLGAPTSAFGVTFGLACVTFATSLTAGTKQFGPIGFWLNQIPHMDLPWWLTPLKVPIFLIEVLGLCIKHAILSVRLLANMVAGHLVLLGILGLIVVAAEYSISHWLLVSSISVVSSTLFSVLELFVAFLQAYIFTFLSALFIGAAVHHH